jgi:hypothetical protein
LFFICAFCFVFQGFNTLGNQIVHSHKEEKTVTLKRHLESASDGYVMVASHRGDWVAGGMGAIALEADGTLTGASCWRADGTPIGLGGGYARSGIRFWPDRTPSSPA